MQNDNRKNVFMQAHEQDLLDKAQAVAGEKPALTAAPAAAGGGKYLRYSGRKQVSFGIDADLECALELRRTMQREKYSDTLNAALRDYLKPELDMLIAAGVLDSTDNG